MSDQQPKRQAKDVYLLLRPLSQRKRRGALAELRTEDPDLAQEVERLLGFDELPTVAAMSASAGTPGEADTKAQRIVELDPDAPPDRIGPYRLQSLVGEGAFGVVYSALQQGSLDRRVAIKILKAGIDSSEVRLRFEAERRALALLDHPGIAKIHEAGRTPDDRPYFVMEFVDGLPINEYCEDHDVDLRERLGLFISVCRAVAHSHQKGIIHRDLKPANVMMTLEDGRPTPKVIDFGIAKITGTSARAGSGATMTGQVIGTPVYMSPEQLEGLSDIDTRADIYSLGVILFELLTGTTPVTRESLKGLGLSETCHALLEADAPRPSARLQSTEIDERSPMSEGKWLRDLRGDLDWIVMTALEKDRNRRYESASALANDIERFLENHPVRARPPSTLYRMRKFARRHRGGLAAATTVMILLVVGTVGTAMGFVEARRAQRAEEDQRAVAEKQRDAARAVNDFLNDDLLAAVAPEAMGFDVSLREALDAAARRVEGRFEDQPYVDVSVRLTIGRTYCRLGHLDVAMEFLSRAAERAEVELDPEDPLSIETVHELAEIMQYAVKYAEAKALYEKAVARRTTVLGPEHEQTFRSRLGVIACMSEMGDDLGAEKLLRPLIAETTDHLGSSHRVTLEARRGLALVCMMTGREEEARVILTEGLPDARRGLGEGDILVFKMLHNLVGLAIHRNDLESAESLVRESQRIRQRTFGDDHPVTLINQITVSRVLKEKGDFPAAEALVRKTFEGLSRMLGLGHSVTVQAATFLVEVLATKGDRAGAIAFGESFLADQRAAKADDRSRVPMLREVVALLAADGRQDEVAPYRDELRRIRASSADTSH